MPGKVYVTEAQADAARMIIARNRANGKETSASIRKIAEAQLEITVVKDERAADE
jgi:hypothetical protein